MQTRIACSIALPILIACASTTDAAPPAFLTDPSPDPSGSIGSAALLTPAWVVVGADAKRFLTPQKVMHSYGALIFWPRAADGAPLDRSSPFVVWPSEPIRAARFGSAIAVSGDLLLVGEPGRRGTGVPFLTGRAQLVDLAAEPPQPIAIIPAPESEIGLEFGTSVAIDGATLAIGAPGYTPSGVTGDAGAVYVYVGAGATWTLSFMRTAPSQESTLTPTLWSGFGESVALHANEVLVGAPSNLAADGLEFGRVQRYDRIAGGNLGAITAPVPTLGDRFGAAIAVAGDLLVVAAPGDECGTGSVHCFRRTTSATGPTWLHEATLEAPSAGVGGEGWTGFGNSIAIDRERVVVGTGGVASESHYGFRSAVFRRSGPIAAPTWVLETTIESASAAPTGSPVALDAAGVLIGEASIGGGRMRYQPLDRQPDLDFDGGVGPGDLAILLGAWGASPGSPADFNGDGTVDAADLAYLLGVWS